MKKTIYNKSRSRSRKKNKDSIKKDKSSHENRKYNKESPERSLSRSSSSGYISENQNFDKKLEKLREKSIKNKKIRNEEKNNSNVQIRLPNKNILAGIIQDNIKINKKLDQDELDRATTLLKTVEKNTEKKATLMSSHLNNNLTSDNNEFIYQNINGNFVKLPQYYTCEINVYLINFRIAIKNLLVFTN